MAYLNAIVVRACRCGKKATQRLYNHWNAPQGDYCERCAQRALKAQQESEDQHWAQRAEAEGRDA